MNRKTLFGRLAGIEAGSKSAERQEYFRARMEPLEDRKMLAVLYVNDNWTNDDGPGAPIPFVTTVSGDGQFNLLYGVDAFGTVGGQTGAGAGLIHDAIAASSTGGQVILLPGTFIESDIVIDKPLTLTGSGSSGASQSLIIPEVASAAVASNFGAGTHSGIIIYSPSVNIENLRLNGAGNGALGAGYNYHQGITTLYDGGAYASLHNGSMPLINLGSAWRDKPLESVPDIDVEGVAVDNVFWHGITISPLDGHTYDTGEDSPYDLQIQNSTVTNVGPVGSQDIDRIGILMNNINDSRDDLPGNVIRSTVTNAGVGVKLDAFGANKIWGNDTVAHNGAELAFVTVNNPVLRGFDNQFGNRSDFFGLVVNSAPGNNATGVYSNQSRGAYSGLIINGTKIAVNVQNSTLDGDRYPVFVFGSVLTGPGSGVAGSVGFLVDNSVEHPQSSNMGLSAGFDISGYENGVKIVQNVDAGDALSVVIFDRPNIFGNGTDISVGNRGVATGDLNFAPKITTTGSGKIDPKFDNYLANDGGYYRNTPGNVDPPTGVLAPSRATEQNTGNLALGASSSLNVLLTGETGTTPIFNFNDSAFYEFTAPPSDPIDGIVVSPYGAILSWYLNMTQDGVTDTLIVGPNAVNGSAVDYGFGANNHEITSGPNAGLYQMDPTDISGNTTLKLRVKLGAGNEAKVIGMGLFDIRGNANLYIIPTSILNSTAYTDVLVNLLAPSINLNGPDDNLDLTKITGYVFGGDQGTINGVQNLKLRFEIDDMTAISSTGSKVNTTGTVNLGGAALTGELRSGFAPTMGQTFTIIENDLADAVVGTFAGIAQNGFVTLSGLSFKVNYSGGTGNDVVLTREDGVVVPNISVNTPAAVAEGNAGTTPIVFTVSLSSPAVSDVTVQYATSNGTATAGSDYTGASGTLTFTTGQSSKLVTVLATGDTTQEANETFTLTLSSPTGGTITGATGTGTINNDDTSNISIGNATANEGNAGTTSFLFTVSLSNAADANVTVQYATANGTATTANNDYGATSGTLTFTPGQTSKVVTVLVNGDAANEPNETFTVNLSAASNGTITGATGTGTITNDDGTGIVGRRIFYNQSKFDSNGAGASSLDDNAIATDKSALLPGGGQATFANITSYTRGINGIMVDIQTTHGTLTASDFIFKVGNNNTPSLWGATLETPSITVRPGAGTGGSDRVEIIFTAANSPKNQWLQVVVKGNDTRGGFNTNTGLAASDIFYFGNRIGDDGTGTVGQAITSFLDENSARSHGGAATITNIWDYDRTGLVSATDGLAARFNAGNTAKINIANPPAAPEAAPAVADSGIASALAAKALPQVDKLPGWITNRLAGLDLNSGPIAQYFTNLAEAGGPRAKAILTAADKIADKFGLDDTLLEELLAGLNG